MKTIESKLEGTLLNDPNPFSYFMLVAFEGSGLIRFGLLLLFWPVIRLLEATGMGEIGLRLMIFVSVAGQRESEIESVGRAVLPKFFMDDIDLKAWNMFIDNLYNKRVVVTKMPRIMAEMFSKEHLRADEVVGTELVVNRFGFATGFVKNEVGSVVDGANTSVLSLCKEQKHPPFNTNDQNHHLLRPPPVIFHDGRLVKRPTPPTALLILLWIPLGILLALTRILVGLTLPSWATPYITKLIGGEVIVRGRLPPPPSPSNPGVLFVCTHRTLMDPVVLSTVLNRKIPAVTYSISKLSELLSPIPTVRLTRTRQTDAARIKLSLSRGDLAVCPEGTTCREPFLLRFSALFAELTDRIVPVAMDHRVGLFHATTARGRKGLDPVFFFMNPWPVYEVTFLAMLPEEATCGSGKSPQEVANHVQRVLAATLGFECTRLTRRDKYRVLAGNDGTVASGEPTASFLGGGGVGRKVWEEVLRVWFGKEKEKRF